MLLQRADTGEVSSAISFQPAAVGYDLPSGDNEYGIEHQGRASTNGHHYGEDQNLARNRWGSKRLRAMWDRHIHQRAAAEECHGDATSPRKAERAGTLGM